MGLQAVQGAPGQSPSLLRALPALPMLTHTWAARNQGCVCHPAVKHCLAMTAVCYRDRTGHCQAVNDAVSI